MSLADLPPLPALIHPEANAYAARCLAATRSVQERVRTIIDVRYGTDYWQKLDLYLPDVPAAGPSLAVLVFFHGGGWTSGTKEWMGFMAPPLLATPAIFVAANYRLAPTVRYPVMLDDCLAAIAWVWHHIGDYGGDRRRLFVGGHSAGGHLASLAALDGSRQRAAGLPEDAIRGCLAISGSFDLRSRAAAPGSAERRIYDLVLDETRDDADASPVMHVSSQSPPLFIAWGERDFPRLVSQAQAMVARLRSVAVDVEAMRLPELDHFGANEICGDTDSAWCRSARTWLGRLS